MTPAAKNRAHRGSELLVKVFVTPRKGILDPQGRAVEQSLKSLGFGGVGAVSVGRYIVLELDAPNLEQAREAVRRMCDQLLTNPNIEDYTFEIDPKAEGGSR
jgi:phosphoribosylformylglycinamidine synthase subunit PurS